MNYGDEYVFSFAHLDNRFIQPIYGKCSHYIHLRTKQKLHIGFLGFSRGCRMEAFTRQKWVQGHQSLTWFMEHRGFFGVDTIGQSKQICMQTRLLADLCGFSSGVCWWRLCIVVSL